MEQLVEFLPFDKTQIPVLQHYKTKNVVEGFGESVVPSDEFKEVKSGINQVFTY